ncbi:MAG: FkbM family methyltransferase [Candidatus Parvarchaeota archaeon]
MNAGYGNNSEIKVDESSEDGIGGRVEASRRGENVRLYSLRKIIKENHLNDAVLKMDCEGCEYGLLDEECSVLSKFNRIAMEYHLGPEKIIDKLKGCGFAVNIWEETRNRQIGNIYAEKVQ